MICFLGYLICGVLGCLICEVLGCLACENWGCLICGSLELLIWLVRSCRLCLGLFEKLDEECFLRVEAVLRLVLDD